MTAVFPVIRGVRLKGMRDRKGGTVEVRNQHTVNIANDMHDASSLRGRTLPADVVDVNLWMVS